MIDEVLKAGRKALRTVPGSLLLGPTGARLWADYVEARPGFVGRFDFIHKLNIPLLYTVAADGRSVLLEPAECEWRPSHLRLRFESIRLAYEEFKFVTWDDCAVSCQTWTNKDASALTLRLLAPPGFTPSGEAGLAGGFDIPFYSFDIDAHIAVSEPSLLAEEGLRLEPGQSASFVVAAALGIRTQDDRETFRGRAERLTRRPGLDGAVRKNVGEPDNESLIRTVVKERGNESQVRAVVEEPDNESQVRTIVEEPDNESLIRTAVAEPDQPSLIRAVVEEQCSAYQAWFDRAPTFRSSDPVLDKTWAYRWFVLRHNLADPRYGLLRHPLFYEGRSHKKGKKPFSKGGWEFSKLINLSVPLHLTDARWHRDPSPSEGALRNMMACPDETGMFCCLTADERLHSFANFVCWAAYRLFLIHRNEDFMREALSGLKAQVASWSQVYGNERDALMTEYRHTRTGKEYQPSYWYFHGYPRNPKDPAGYTHVKRVDRTVYHYLNALGVARLCEALGDAEAERYASLAERIRADVLEKMWDESTRFFYDLHYETDEKALVKNIVGIYPAWAEMIDDRHDGLIDHLLDPKSFATGCPYPTVSADSEPYAREGGWFGHFVKGRNGCMWNGPTWPYTNSIALDALARESKRRGHAYDFAFGQGLRDYAYLHYQDRDLTRPALVEHYNSANGEPLSDEQEYNHSYYIDLVVSHVAGLAVERDAIRLDPLDIGLDYFELGNVRAAGVELRVTYGRPGLGRYPQGIEPGYRLYADGRPVFSAQMLSRAEVSLAF